MGCTLLHFLMSKMCISEKSKWYIQLYIIHLIFVFYWLKFLNEFMAHSHRISPSARGTTGACCPDATMIAATPGSCLGCDRRLQGSRWELQWGWVGEPRQLVGILTDSDSSPSAALQENRVGWGGPAPPPPTRACVPQAGDAGRQGAWYSPYYR